MDALERSDFDQACSIADNHHAIAAAAVCQRMIAAFRNRLCAPLDHFATLQVLLYVRMRLERLQQLVHIERCLPVVESDNESERNDIRLERIDEAAAECIGWE